MVTSVGLVPPQACVFTVLESSATSQTLIQKVGLTGAYASTACFITGTPLEAIPVLGAAPLVLSDH